MSKGASVTIAVPVLNEEATIARCLDAIEGQSYDNIVEVLLVDGGSTDATVSIAALYPSVRVLHNPLRRQAHALNLALVEAKGDILVRVDGHAFIAEDYVECCVDALLETGAAMVGGRMWPEAEGPLRGGIAAAMRSPFGAGPAIFRVGKRARWADTVYLGAYRVETAKDAGGYSTDEVSEDSEFALRMGRLGGVWYDPSIRSTYEPRDTIRALGVQYYRYGRMRALTVRRHPASLKLRQLASPLLVLGLLSSARKRVAKVYVIAVILAAVRQRERPSLMPATVLALPVMHLAWGVGFLRGLGHRESPTC